MAEELLYYCFLTEWPVYGGKTKILKVCVFDNGHLDHASGDLLARRKLCADR